jgi:hypothetical protein
MPALRLLVVAGLLAPALGCTWVREQWGIGRLGGSPAIPKVTADDLVAYLNNQASRLQSISYGDLTVSAREGLVRYPNLRGNLSAAQPRYFRLVAKGGLVDAKIDLGSNPEQFWAYIAAPTLQPMYVFASHSDFESGKARLPGNMPFEPDWVMQALGMISFPPNLPYTVRTDEKERTYVLSWPSTTPGGIPVRKEIVFLADDADAARNQAQVRRHLVRDAAGKPICLAEIKAARTIPVGGNDPKSGRPFVVQYPTEVDLRWEEQRFEMTLRLDAARVNQQLTPEDTRRLFSLPNIGGATPINLAYARFDGTGR